MDGVGIAAETLRVIRKAQPGLLSTFSRSMCIVKEPKGNAGFLMPAGLLLLQLAGIYYLKKILSDQCENRAAAADFSSSSILMMMGDFYETSWRDNVVGSHTKKGEFESRNAAAELTIHM